MAGKLEGKVAFITGAARGQGRSHAIRLAEEGADIIAVDIAAQVASVPYPMATPDDLAETVKEVEALDRRIVATQADARDYGALKAALDDGVAQLGRLDIVSANAGIASYGLAAELDETTWQDMIDTNLTPHSIRVNSVHPTGVNTPMVQNEASIQLFLPDVENPTAEQYAEVMGSLNALPIPWVEPRDISNAVLFLASDEARYITGVTLPVDAGSLAR